MSKRRMPIKMYFLENHTDNGSATADEQESFHAVLNRAMSHCIRARGQDGVASLLGGVVSGREHQGSSGEQHDGSRIVGGGGSEGRLGLADTGSEEGAAENKKQVGQDAAQERGLNNAEFTLGEGDNANDGCGKRTDGMVSICGLRNRQIFLSDTDLQ